MAATYIVDFTSLNGSGVTGTANLDYDPDARALSVSFNVFGLDPNGGHVAHIHGLFANGQPADSTTPTSAQDTDGDGFIELGEGAQIYGDVLLPLGDIGSNAAGVSTYSMTYDLSDSSIFNADYDEDDLTPFELREVVIHGLTVPQGPGAGTDGEVDGTNGYLATLPVASGEIMAAGMGAVPEPGTWAMLIVGFGAIGGSLRAKGAAKRRLGKAMAA
ncbi:PEPxxWA-CTERM sorting domain-containing protein [Qipengyuania sp.]|uniref:PEPxxWA-CTERM sorting domain-containing protein n=1 Tax=Qipengyuania sp. TaxID=2004515 RepID=UPI0035C7E6B4